MDTARQASSSSAIFRRLKAKKTRPRGFAPDASDDRSAHKKKPIVFV